MRTIGSSCTRSAQRENEPLLLVKYPTMRCFPVNRTNVGIVQRCFSQLRLLQTGVDLPASKLEDSQLRRQRLPFSEIKDIMSEIKNILVSASLAR